MRLAGALGRREPGEEFGLAEAVQWSGIPEHLCEPALAYLAAAEGAHVRYDEGRDALVYCFDNPPMPPTMWRLPEGLQWFLDGVREFARPIVHYFAVTGISFWFGAVFLLYSGVFYVDQFASAPLQATIFTVLGLIGAFLIAPLVFSFGLFYLIAGCWNFLADGNLLGVLGVGVFGGVLIGFLGWIMPALFELSEMLYEALAPLRNFGRERRDDLSDERRVTELMAAHDGVLTTRDLVRLFGWTNDEAHRELTRLLVDYGGDIQISDEGAMIFHFPDVGETEVESSPEPVWEWERAPAETFDRAARRSDIVALVLSGIAAAGVYIIGDKFGAGGEWVGELGPDMLMYASVPFLAVAGVTVAYVLIRRLVVAMRQRRWARRQKFLELVRQATETPDGLRVSMSDVDREMVSQLDGDLDVESADGDEVVLSFESFTREKRAAAEARAGVGSSAPIT